MTNTISTVDDEIQHETLEGNENYPMVKRNEDDEEKDLKEEIDYITNDPVRKYQFDYNQSLCMANRYPEIEIADPTKEIQIAPGEGKRPYDITREIDWDVKAFPHLHNLDGSNGKDAERMIKLTDQSYFIQRILNKDQRFARSAAYKYVAVAYIEKQQLQKNINLAGTRGKKLKQDDGNITYEIDDGYAVLDNVRNTPRYWKKVKHEMIAILDNLGAFQLFCTLSCADLRWEENFAAILHDLGLNLSLIPDEIGFPFTKIQVIFKKEGIDQKMDLQQFIEEELDTSMHELVRGNVLLAT